MRTKFVKLLFLLLCVNLSVAAQTARSVLDQTASRLSSRGGLQANFSMTAYVGNRESGAATGTIYIQGNSFKVESQQMKTWFDGKTQWSLMAGSDEVYVSNPTAAELQSVNPYYFLNLYKSGYNYQLVSTTYNGKACHEVRLGAQKADQDIREMRIVIDKATYTPYSVRLKQKNGNWTRIRVSNLSTGKSWAQSFFQFNRKDFPKVDVIDLR